MGQERLQKILARAGVASRRASEELVREGRVTVNGRVASLGQKADADSDAIRVDGRRLRLQRQASYLLLNKPAGVLSTRSDPKGRPTVLDLVPAEQRKALKTVGRLDFHSQGLLLLTNDGELANRITHPRYGCSKTYEVKVKGRPSEPKLNRLQRGIVLRGRRTAPCIITPRRPPAGTQDGQNTWWSIVLSEGRTRQIREMFQRIGHPVQKLRRVAIGPLRDPDLPVGAWRHLTEREVELLRRSSRRRRGPDRRQPPRKKLRRSTSSRP